jgi:hypothetical protein
MGSGGSSSIVPAQVMTGIESSSISLRESGRRGHPIFPLSREKICPVILERYEPGKISNAPLPQAFSSVLVFFLRRISHFHEPCT